MSVYPGALGELREVTLCDSAHPTDLEILKALYDGEMGHGEPTFEAPVTAVLQLDINQAFEKGQAGHSLALGELKKTADSRIESNRPISIRTLIACIISYNSRLRQLRTITQYREISSRKVPFRVPPPVCMKYSEVP
jgi:hypothetical protein